jgi:DNA repair exonuclease SbcCD ATPase subunit
MEELNELIKKLSEVKAQQKALAEKETFYKELLMKALKEVGLEKEDSDYGSIRIQRRSEKDYGEEVSQQEASLKQLKKLKDDIGDFTIVSTKESLVYNPPKDLF